MTWAQLEDLWRQLLYLYASEWKCPLPERNLLPLASVESECDVWCSKLAQQLGDPLPAPPHVQPWILARLAMCAGYAKLAGQSGHAPPTQFSVALAEHLLVAEWHASLRDLWTR